MSENLSDGRLGRWAWPRVAGWSLAALMLLTPLVAMQFTEEVAWTVGDFVFFALMLLVVGVSLELAVRASRDTAYRAAAGIALLSGFLLLWANGAVGVIGNEDHPVNLAYFGVLAIGIVGGFVARFRAAGMVWAMGGAALAVAVVAAGALAAGLQHTTGSPVREILLVNGFFAGLFGASAALFRGAAGRQG